MRDGINIINFHMYPNAMYIERVMDLKSEKSAFKF